VQETPQAPQLESPVAALSSQISTDNGQSTHCISPQIDIARPSPSPSAVYFREIRRHELRLTQRPGPIRFSSLQACLCAWPACAPATDQFVGEIIRTRAHNLWFQVNLEHVMRDFHLAIPAFASPDRQITRPRHVCLAPRRPPASRRAVWPFGARTDVAPSTDPSIEAHSLLTAEFPAAAALCLAWCSWNQIGRSQRSVSHPESSIKRDPRHALFWPGARARSSFQPTPELLFDSRLVRARTYPIGSTAMLIRRARSIITGFLIRI
jgi:hypothetical protein